MRHVLAIDQGTSGTKALVVDASGTVLAVAQQPVSARHAADGSAEQDPRELLRSVIDSGRRASADSGVRIDAVALANQGESVLAWNPASGTPLSPVVGWQDRRAAVTCDELQQHAGVVERRSGLRLDPYFSAPKMRWLRDHVTREGVVTTTDTWLVHQLCDAFVTDVATASRSALVALGEQDWDPELLEVFGLGDERRPEVVSCDEGVGTTSAFGRDLPVAGLVLDQTAALLAQGCLAPGDAKCTLGTGAFLVASTGRRPVLSTAGLSSSVAWKLGGATTYCLDAQVYVVASAVRWLVELGLLSGPRELDRVVAETSDGVVCVPALSGMGAPWWRPRATASWSGMTLAHGRGHLVRAVLEGIAAQVAVLGEALQLDTGTPWETLQLDGGLTGCRTLVQALADLLQVPVRLAPSMHATALGAAACAHVSLDPSLALASMVAPPTGEVVEPQWSSDRAESFLHDWSASVSTAASNDSGTLAEPRSRPG